ncbi:hypothetical protein SUDANB70_00103 [Streptomyces sp. enrichment culture]
MGMRIPPPAGRHRGRGAAEPLCRDGEKRPSRTAAPVPRPARQAFGRTSGGGSGICAR